MMLPGLSTAQRGLRVLAGSTLVPIRFRAFSLSKLGVTGIASAALGHGIVFCNPRSVTMGPGCFVNNHVYFDAGPVSIGKNVTIGPRTVFLTGAHDIGPPSRRASDGEHLTTTIGDGAWIGAGVILLPGVSVGAGCVVGAGAVVTSDCAPHGVYAGVPARCRRDLETEERQES